MLNPIHLRTLEAVCRTGSFAIAARELGYTPSGVSQQMATLERFCGLELFERQAHGITATAAAARLVERAEQVLAVLGAFEEEVRELSSGRGGRLRLGSFPTAGVRLVPDALAGLAEAHGTAEILLEEAEPEELLGQLTEGRLDAALLYAYECGGTLGGPAPDGPSTDGPSTDGLVREQLLREPLVLLTPESRPRGEPLSALGARPWIATRPGSAGAAVLERLCAAEGFAPDIVLRSNNYDVVRRLVAAGLGVALVPALGHAAHPRVHARPLTAPPAHRRITLAYRAANPNPLLPAVLHSLRATAARTAAWPSLAL